MSHKCSTRSHPAGPGGLLHSRGAQVQLTRLDGLDEVVRNADEGWLRTLLGTFTQEENRFDSCEMMKSMGLWNCQWDCEKLWDTWKGRSTPTHKNGRRSACLAVCSFSHKTSAVGFHLPQEVIGSEIKTSRHEKRYYKT